MKSFSEYINEDFLAEKDLTDEIDIKFLAYPKKGKLQIAKDLYYYESIHPHPEIPLWTISTNEADVQKRVDKELKELKRKKAFKDRLEEFKVSKLSKGSYEYEIHTRKYPDGKDTFMSITIPLDRMNFFVIDRWCAKKLDNQGVLKIS